MEVLWCRSAASGSVSVIIPRWYPSQTAHFYVTYLISRLDALLLVLSTQKQPQIYWLLTASMKLLARSGTTVLVRSSETKPLIIFDAFTYMNLFHLAKQGHYCSWNGLRTLIKFPTRTAGENWKLATDFTSYKIFSFHRTSQSSLPPAA